MKKLTKVLTVFAAMLVLAAVFTGAAAAAPDDKTTTISYSVSEGFTWEIPGSVTFGALNETKTGNCILNTVNLGDTSKVTVSVYSKNLGKLSNDKTGGAAATLPYTLQKTVPGGTATDVPLDTATSAAPLQIFEFQSGGAQTLPYSVTMTFKSGAAIEGSGSGTLDDVLHFVAQIVPVS